LKQLNLLKKRNRDLKVLLSVGGWTYSSNFAAPASTAAGRAAFVRACVDLVRNLGFDGIDIDWEYPQNAQQASDYVALLAEVRKGLDEYATSVASKSDNNKPYHFELTVASPAGPQNFEKMDLAGMDKYLDFWNLMAYDYAGSWDSVAAHQANLFAHKTEPSRTPFSTEAAIAYYNSHGVAANKIVLGMPLYGRAFENTEGLGKPYQGVGQGSWEQGVYDFKALPLAGAEERMDEDAGASYCYSADKKTLVTYDTAQMTRNKAEYIKEKGLGGAMWWESSADKAGDESLICTVVQALGGSKALRWDENCLTYPETRYENLKSGFPNN
jgi:chitinase